MLLGYCPESTIFLCLSLRSINCSILGAVIISKIENCIVIKYNEPNRYCLKNHQYLLFKMGSMTDFLSSDFYRIFFNFSRFFSYICVFEFFLWTRICCFFFFDDFLFFFFNKSALLNISLVNCYFYFIGTVDKLFMD